MSVVSALPGPESIVTDVSKPITESHQCEPSAAMRPQGVKAGKLIGYNG
jgi:hypothetical protein